MADTEEVAVLSRSEVRVQPLPGINLIEVRVVYQAIDMPVASVGIDKRRWTPEMEARVIQADIQVRRSQLRPLPSAGPGSTGVPPVTGG